MTTSLTLVTDLQTPSVDALMAQLAAGDITFGELVAEFSRRDWSIPPMSNEAIHRGDEEPLPANDWAPVEVARRAGHITTEQYEALDEARGPILWR